MKQSPAPTAFGRDPDAFEAFYRAHVRAVETFIARRVDDPHVAADLTADVFVAVIERSHTYDPRLGNEVAWLFGIARNVVADRLRNRARELRAVSRIRGRALLDEDSLAHIEARLDAERDARRTLTAMACLAETDRAILELVSVDGLPLADVAALLGVEPGTARVRLHRARQRLASVLADEDTLTLTTQEA